MHMRLHSCVRCFAVDHAVRRVQGCGLSGFMQVFLHSCTLFVVLQVRGGGMRSRNLLFGAVTLHMWLDVGGGRGQVCDSTTSCPPGATCCCLREFFGYCFTWACCPLVEATCCDDHEHCCPSSLPVCDTIAGRCLADKGVWEGSQPWAQKFPAMRGWSRAGLLPAVQNATVSSATEGVAAETA